MVNNMNDIYKLVKSPAYHATCNQWKQKTDDVSDLSFNLVNDIAPLDYIHVKICHTDIEISKPKNMNSEFYAHLSTTNKRGKRFYDILMAKHSATMAAAVEENHR